MSISIIPKEGQRPDWDQMMPGEIYSEGGSTGMGPMYTVPEYNPMDPRQVVNRSTGYEANRLVEQAPQMQEHVEYLEQMSGQPQPEVAARYGREMPMKQMASMIEGVDRYERMSDIDRMALDLMNAGRITPVEFYKIAKEDDRKREEAMLNWFQKGEIERLKLSSKDGKPLPITGGNVSDMMSRYGEVQGGFGAKSPTRSIQTIYSNTGGKNSGSGSRSGSGSDTGYTAKEMKDIVKPVEDAVDNYNSLITGNDALDFSDPAVQTAYRTMTQAKLARALYEDPDIKANLDRALTVSRNVAGSNTAMAGPDLPVFVKLAGEEKERLNLDAMWEGAPVRYWIWGLMKDPTLTNPETKKPWTVAEIADSIRNRSLAGQ